MTEPERRRRRPPISCLLCRKRKIRCNREKPCSNCLKSRNNVCVYDDNLTRPPRPRAELVPKPHAVQERHAAHRDAVVHLDFVSQTATSTPSLTGSRTTFGLASPATPAPDVELLKARITELEDQLSRTTSKPCQTVSTGSPISSASDPDLDPGPVDLSSVTDLGNASRSKPQAQQLISSSIMHKNRLFGRSYWVNGAVLIWEICDVLDPYLRDERSKISMGMRRAKQLSRTIKRQREPQWPPTPQDNLPPREIADDLVERYLRTVEVVLRILHIPTFKAAYGRFWEQDSQPDTAFIIQLKLILAVGATVGDDQFSLRNSAIYWIYEAQSWTSEPKFKSRLTIQSLQTDILLLIARETANVGGSLTWILAGTILRSAMFMGLHRDPRHLPKMTVCMAETRRRIWNTVLQLVLQSSMNSGGPPLISPSDFDTEPPGNFDDDDLLAENPAPKPPNSYTQMTLAIAFRKTFPIRLAIHKFLNDLNSSNTYEEVLRLDKELHTASKNLAQDLLQCKLADGSTPSQFETRLIDFIMTRHLLSLHIPFFGLAVKDAAYAYTRTVVIETSLKLWCTVYPSTCAMLMDPDVEATPAEQTPLARLAINGSGFFRLVAMQACFLIALELKTQLEESSNLGPPSLRSDLLSVLRDAKSWSLQRVEAGEVSIKGHLYISLVAAQIDGLRRRLDEEDLSRLMVKTAEEAQDRCLRILEAKAHQGATDGPMSTFDQTHVGTSSNSVQDVDLLMSDFYFNFDDAESGNWLFSGEDAQEPMIW